ncbi:hypothetical protein VNI00_013216 [Paramarasmius palmivorus]|uniref:Uncharacterized protein n=1 Tax=Paramarasmius palmivorus TaxID=297713 RepID=A0AAW0C3F8_9AGAR
MPTATMTENLPPASLKQTSTATDTKTLRTLYNRAAKAFLKRNITLTHSLLQTAFSTISSDSDSDLQRKWDILRITFETTVYTSGIAATEFPDQLKEITVKSPQNLVTETYSRSLAFFSSKRVPESSVVLPVQVLSTLVYSSLKLDAAQVGREMIEDWLGRRGNSYYSASSHARGDGYDKVLELYVLQVLPKLEEWEYATEFMEYESQLDPDTRQNIQLALRTQHAQVLSARYPPQSQQSSSSPSPLTSRPQSPTPSSSSSSSSLSTTSTHTAVPATPRQHAPFQHSLSSLSSLDSSITSSSSRASSDGTVTPNRQSTKGKGKASAYPEGNGNALSDPSSLNDATRPKSRSPARSRGSGSSNHSPRVPPSQIQHTHPLNPNSPNPLSLPRSHLTAAQSNRGRNLSTYALIKASLQPYFTRLSGSRGGAILTGTFLFFVLPAISVLLRLRSRRRIGGVTSGGTGTADIVRRRLRGVNGSDSTGLGMVLARTWWAIVRVVFDTVRMGVSGLV